MLTLLIISLSITFSYSFLSVPGSSPDAFDVRNVRDYYLQAEKVEWNYLPYGQNLVNNYDE